MCFDFISYLFFTKFLLRNCVKATCVCVGCCWGVLRPIRRLIYGTILRLAFDWSLSIASTWICSRRWIRAPLCNRTTGTRIQHFRLRIEPSCIWFPNSHSTPATKYNRNTFSFRSQLKWLIDVFLPSSYCIATFLNGRHYANPCAWYDCVQHQVVPPFCGHRIWWQTMLRHRWADSATPEWISISNRSTIYLWHWHVLRGCDWLPVEIVWSWINGLKFFKFDSKTYFSF